MQDEEASTNKEGERRTEREKKDLQKGLGLGSAGSQEENMKVCIADSASKTEQGVLR